MTETKLKYDLMNGIDLQERTLEFSDQLIDRLKFNTGHVTTTASRKVIKYGVEQFSLDDMNPHQIGYCMSELANCKYKNVAISEMLIHLKYLRNWRYFFRLIGKRRHHISDLYKLAVTGNSDVVSVFRQEWPKVHNHKSFIAFMWTIRTTLDFDEMIELNHCASYWQTHSSRIIPTSRQSTQDIYLS